jgi:divalent metal cation (Fe/Co/Zn/Cd) transporter
MQPKVCKSNLTFLIAYNVIQISSYKIIVTNNRTIVKEKNLNSTGPSVLAIKLVLSEILLNSKINLAKKFSFNECKQNMLNNPNAIRRCGSGGSSNSSSSKYGPIV